MRLIPTSGLVSFVALVLTVAALVSCIEDDAGAASSDNQENTPDSGRETGMADDNSDGQTADNGNGLTTGLQVLGVYVSDLERARAFYTEVLGFTQTGEMPPGLLLSAGGENGLTLYLEAGRTAPEASVDSLLHPAFAPCLATASVKQAFETLKAKGVRMVSEYQQFGPEFAMFRCTDPDGNLIEFAGKP